MTTKNETGPTAPFLLPSAMISTEAVQFAENSPYPEPEEALDHVYSFSIRERELNRKAWTCSTPSAASK